MKSHPALMTASVALMCAAAFQIAAAQEPKPADLRTEVPVYTKMHDVIGPMWHDAWPAKDIKALTRMLPSIEKHTAALANVDLPGIFREEVNAWMAGVGQLQVAVSEYRAAVQDGNVDAVLRAVEAVHTRYEDLGRLIRPAIPELGDIHATLYEISTYQTNPVQLAKIMTSAPDLRRDMDKLNQAQLPEPLQPRRAEFEAQREKLSKSVDALLASLLEKNEARIVEAIELARIEYQKLVKSLQG